jgi:two-component system nitrate/nitrite response regulator NarL
MISTYLFEHNTLLREGLKSFLAGTDFLVTAEFDCISEFTTVNATPPDLIITGISKKSDCPMDAVSFVEFIEHTAYVRSCIPGAKLVILVSTEEIGHISDLLQCNADGYILQDISRDAILNYLELAMIGEKVLPHPIALLFASFREGTNLESANRLTVGLFSLSKRENEIVQCLILGESNKLIARHLDITESTVKVHLKTILRKLGVQNRTQAALLAANHGLERNNDTQDNKQESLLQQYPAYLKQST